MSEKTWLDRNKVTKAFEKADEAAKAEDKLPALDFTKQVGVPVFFKIISEMREIEQTFPDPKTGEPIKTKRRIIDKEILEDSPDGLRKAAEQYSWWPNQTVIKTKLKQYEPLKVGDNFCVVCLGKVKGAGPWPYWNYYIGTADEGHAVLIGMGGK